MSGTFQTGTASIDLPSIDHEIKIYCKYNSTTQGLDLYTDESCDPTSQIASPVKVQVDGPEVGRIYFYMIHSPGVTFTNATTDAAGQDPPPITWPDETDPAVPPTGIMLGKIRTDKLAFSIRVDNGTPPSNDVDVTFDLNYVTPSGAPQSLIAAIRANLDPSVKRSDVHRFDPTIVEKGHHGGGSGGVK